MNRAMHNYARETRITDRPAKLDDDYFRTADGRDTRTPITNAYPVCSCQVLNHVAGTRNPNCAVHGD